MNSWTTIYVLVSLCIKQAVSRNGAACVVKDWKPLHMVQLMVQSENVLIGKQTNNYTLFDSFFANFDVLCVLKSDDGNIYQNITIFSEYPISKCSRTARSYNENDIVIIGLRRLGNVTFTWDEQMPITSVAFPMTFNNLLELSSVCGLQAWRKPVDAISEMCPICSNHSFFESAAYPNNSTTCLQDLNRMCTNVPRVEIKGKCSCDVNEVTVGDGGSYHTVSFVVLLLMIKTALFHRIACE